jgi:T4 RnlA family RNA ligase
MFSLEKLERYEKDGLLRSQIHPTYPLRIYNYTETVQFEKKWDYITSACRGLVVEIPTGKVIARPFPKFFNIEEKKHVESDSFELYEKVDGSLGILFRYQGDIILATRGSFTSDQATKGLEILWNKYERYIDALFHWRAEGAKNAKTILFEIVYPENRVVVKYDEEKLIMLGAYDKYHVEMNYDDLPPWPDKVPKFEGMDYRTVQSLNTPNSEGFVVKFDNGSRCKIKFEDYVRLHRVMTNFSSKAVFECLKNGKDLREVLKDTPDEFYASIQEFADDLESKYQIIEYEAESIFDAIGHIANRKKFAEQALSTEYADILFKMKDEKDYSDLIWKRIEPKYEKLS